MNQNRTILHCDLNGFYASVECLLRPELKEVPMAVCGDPDSRHGIILAKNELAKAYQVTTAETIWQAQRKCPNLTLVAPHHSEYAKYSKLVNKIYERFTDCVEPFGIDESWLDITGTLHLFGGDAKQIADTIRETVKKELGLTVSVGVSFNKIYAKLGSDYKKPDATTVISPDNYREIVYPLPVTALLYVGKAAAKTLKLLGVRTIGDLAGTDRTLLAQKLGKMGEMLHDYAAGLDDSPVKSAYEEREVKSVGNGMTFRRNLQGLEDIKAGAAALSDTVATRLRHYGLECYTVQVQVRDPQFNTISRQKTLEYPTHLGREIYKAAIELVLASWKLNAPIRMLTVTAANLVPQGSSEQLSLFNAQEKPKRERQDKLEHTMDHIRGKFGRSAIGTAALLGSDLGIKNEKPIDR
ncbi:DNA polymerase-4 [Hydrogenoanaerobacterium saccharovorans]|uniref:DNA polymerase IV n=1 Tax=Hydrogenoanaerobacterium saccharovorans TaxID=474960 RepID=A0A1H8ADJ5_9FIRM|nr:DNA polymerase IV [Hydrogenoanaerobacterium saccharovorans]RPF48043.1 DNA polymerase-4 [Hydrogenoanaerobacterium saccharovorans]SEM67994.1 DNA polymerase-4 [Hydrogenoanaerobacterium saccharovorans]